VGGNNFSHDVALGLRTTQINAEAIKHKEGYALPDMAGPDESIEVESVGGRAPRTVARSSLCRILEARADETLKLIQKELQEKHFIGKLGSGMVLTGGAAELRGLVEMGDFILDMPVRLGRPSRTGGLADVVSGASFSVAVGLLLYGYAKDRPEIVDRESATGVSQQMNEIGRRIKSFFARAL
jgi:cell division protein FtsA